MCLNTFSGGRGTSSAVRINIVDIPQNVQMFGDEEMK